VQENKCNKINEEYCRDVIRPVCQTKTELDCSGSGNNQPPQNNPNQPQPPAVTPARNQPIPGIQARNRPVSNGFTPSSSNSGNFADPVSDFFSPGTQANINSVVSVFPINDLPRRRRGSTRSKRKDAAGSSQPQVGTGNQSQENKNEKGEKELFLSTGIFQGDSSKNNNNRRKRQNAAGSSKPQVGTENQPQESSKGAKERFLSTGIFQGDSSKNNNNRKQRTKRQVLPINSSLVANQGTQVVGSVEGMPMNTEQIREQERFLSTGIFQGNTQKDEDNEKKRTKRQVFSSGQNGQNAGVRQVSISVLNQATSSNQTTGQNRRQSQPRQNDRIQPRQDTGNVQTK
jgi:hypothetical protein